MDNKKPFPITNFAGGYCGNLPSSQLGLNQALDLDNIVLSTTGLGFRSRLGDVAYSTPLNGTNAIQGAGYLDNTSDRYLVAVAGSNKVYSSGNFGGSFSDISGSLTVTGGQDSQWTFVSFSNKLLGFGGPINTPDAPFQYTGSGNATILSTAPSAYGAFSANNRVFAYRTSANKSTIYWSVLGDYTDWSGTGSGSAVVGSLNDNGSVTAHAVLSTNYALIFKNTRTYQLILSAAPFPIYSFSDTVGCVGKNAVVTVDGTAYWITQYGRMVSSKGEGIDTYPNSADDLWASVSISRYPYISGFRQKGSDFDWIVWLVSTNATSNNLAIIWDLQNKCWLKCSTGYKFALGIFDPPSGNYYFGNYVGQFYKLNVAATYADASESPTTIASYWRSGWLNPGSPEQIVHIDKIVATYTVKASGNITVNYGFDFTADSKSFTLAQAATASETATSRSSQLTGRGNFFQFKIGLSSSTIDMGLHSLTLYGKATGQKRISAS